MWGIFHLSYFNWWQQVLLVVLAIIFILVSYFIDKHIKVADKIHKPGVKYFILVDILLIFSFILFREKLYIHGDEAMLASTISDKLLTPSVEFGDTLIHRVMYSFVKIYNISGFEVYRWLSIFSGILFLTTLTILAVKEKDSLKGWFIYVWFTSMGSIMLFYGYGESYSLLNVAVFLFILSLYKELEKISLIKLTALFAGSVFLHTSAICLIVPLIMLVFMKSKRTVQIIASIISFGIIILLLYIIQIARDKSIFALLLPIFPSVDKPYAMFSWGHILDIFNVILLTAPIAIIFIMALIPVKINRVNIWLLISFISILAGVFMLDIYYEAMDWDLMAFMGIPLMFFALDISKEKGILERPIKYCGVITAIIIFHTAPWVMSNHNESIALSQFSDVIKRFNHDDSNWLYARNMMYYNSNNIKRPDIALKIGDQALRNGVRDARIYSNMAKAYFYLGEWAKALNYGLESVKCDSTYENGWFMVAVNAGKLAQWELSCRAYEKTINLREPTDEIYYGMGLSLFNLGNIKDAEKNLLEAIMLNSMDITYYKMLFYIYYSSGQYTNALKIVDAGLHLFKTDAELMVSKGIVLFLLNEQIKARDIWLKVVALEPNHKKANDLLYLAAANKLTIAMLKHK